MLSFGVMGNINIGRKMGRKSHEIFAFIGFAFGEKST